MKNRVLFFLIMQFVFCSGFSQRVKLDTIYYDKEWKVVPNITFATYYRVHELTRKTGSKKHFRDYYVSGELHAEGNYISIDKYDDSKSVFDGEWVKYNKLGRIIEKGYRNMGVEDGEYIAYYDNGLVKKHVKMSKGAMNGILTEFNEGGDVCTQIEMLEGKPMYDYYFISNNKGFGSKMRISDNTPIYDSPDLSELKIQYRDGIPWLYYVKNGIIISMANVKVKDYGTWYKVWLMIQNNSFVPVEFDPEKITSSLKKQNHQEIALDVWSSERFMKKVRKSQNLNLAIMGVLGGLSAASAGYSSSTTITNSTYSGYSNSYGNASIYGSGGYAVGNYNGYNSYQGEMSTVSNTISYDAAAAYQAQVIASEKMAGYENSLNEERIVKQKGYLRKNTLYPGDAIYGYVNIKYVKGVEMNVCVDIKGAQYDFKWNLSK